jgi:hypothetical protein
VYGNEFQFATMVSWTANAGGAATPMACFNLIRTEGVTSLKPVANATYCVQTSQGNIAIVVVKRIDLDSSNNITDVLVQATIWTNGS